MQQSERGNGQNGEWAPTREFYLGNPRSAQVRGVCIAIVNDFDALLRDPQAACSDRKRESLYRRLLGLDTRLTELGIQPGIHEDLSYDDLEADPIKAVEFIAGVIGQEIGQQITPRSEVEHLIEEFGEIVDGRYRIDLEQPMLAKLKRHLDLRILVEWTHELLATAPSERPTFLVKAI